MGKWILGEELNKLQIKPPKRKGLEYNYKYKSWYGFVTYCSNCLERSFSDSDYGYTLFPFCPFCGEEMENPDYGKKIVVKKPLVEKEK